MSDVIGNTCIACIVLVVIMLGGLERQLGNRSEPAIVCRPEKQEVQKRSVMRHSGMLSRRKVPQDQAGRGAFEVEGGACPTFL